MKISILVAVIIAFLLGGIFLWSRRGEQTTFPLGGKQSESTTTPSPTSAVSSSTTPTPANSNANQETTKDTPATGVNLLVPLLASASLGLSGWYLFKKSKAKV